MQLINVVCIIFRSWQLSSTCPMVVRTFWCKLGVVLHCICITFALNLFALPMHYIHFTLPMHLLCNCITKCITFAVKHHFIRYDFYALLCITFAFALFASLALCIFLHFFYCGYTFFSEWIFPKKL